MHNRKQLGLVLIVITTLVASSCVSLDGQTGIEAEATIRNLRSDVRRTMAQNGIEGLSVVVVDKDGAMWAEGFGSAGRGRALTADTPMLIASITKLFTATAVMTLVENGKVNLDAPIGEYVPEMAGFHYAGAPEPTVRNLLTHHGGIASDLLTDTLFSGNTEGYRTAFMSLVPLIAAEPPTESPNLLAHYSNSGYTLLGALVANVSGMPYAEYVETEILAPSGMTDSGFLDPVNDTTVSRGFAQGEEIPGLRMTGIPEGGIAASASDLGRFMMMLLNGGTSINGNEIVEESSLQEMLRRQNTNVALDFDFQMGLGFHLMALPGYADVGVAWHDGGTHPFASTLLIAPDYGVGVALVSNSDEQLPEDLSYMLMAKAIEAASGLDLSRSRDYAFGPMVGRPLNPEELGGIYATEIGAIQVAGSPERPTLTMAGMTLYLVPREAQSYGLQIRIGGFLPLPIADVARVRLVFRDVGGQRAVGYYEGGKFRSIGLAVEPVPVPAAWESRYGDWDVVNPDPNPFVESVKFGYDSALGFMTLTVAVASLPEPMVFPAQARDEYTLVSAGLGRHMGETLRVEPGAGAETIHWAGLVLEPRMQ